MAARMVRSVTPRQEQTYTSGPHPEVTDDKGGTTGDQAGRGRERDGGAGRAPVADADGLGPGAVGREEHADPVDATETGALALRPVVDVVLEHLRDSPRERHVLPGQVRES